MLNAYQIGINFFSWYRALSDSDTIPTSKGALDRAMQKAAEGNNLSYIAKSFHFPILRTGMYCIELPEMECAATDAGIIAPRNPEYTDYHFLISKHAAKKILGRTKKVPEMQDFVSKVLENLDKP